MTSLQIILPTITIFTLGALAINKVIRNRTLDLTQYMDPVQDVPGCGADPYVAGLASQILPIAGQPHTGGGMGLARDFRDLLGFVQVSHRKTEE